MKFIPLFDRVLIKPIDNEKEKSCLVIPDTIKDRPEIGYVKCVGEGENLNNEKIEMKVKVGDKVLFNKFAGNDIDLDGEKLLVLRQIDIIGVYDEREDNC